MKVGIVMVAISGVEAMVGMISRSVSRNCSVQVQNHGHAPHFFTVVLPAGGGGGGWYPEMPSRSRRDFRARESPKVQSVNECPRLSMKLL